VLVPIVCLSCMAFSGEDESTESPYYYSAARIAAENVLLNILSRATTVTDLGLNIGYRADSDWAFDVTYWYYRYRFELENEDQYRERTVRADQLEARIVRFFGESFFIGVGPMVRKIQSKGRDDLGAFKEDDKGSEVKRRNFDYSYTAYDAAACFTVGNQLKTRESSHVLISADWLRLCFGNHLRPVTVAKTPNEYNSDQSTTYQSRTVRPGRKLDVIDFHIAALNIGVKF
jgi:hypothetical protein